MPRKKRGGSLGRITLDAQRKRKLRGTQNKPTFQAFLHTKNSQYVNILNI